MSSFGIKVSGAHFKAILSELAFPTRKGEKKNLIFFYYGNIASP
jgi:hypothetical protein